MMKVCFIGDVYLNPKHNCGNFTFSKDVKELFSECDNVCINLEAPILNKKNATPLDKKGPNLYQDYSRLASFTELQNVSFCLANNHIMDYGEKGLDSTISFLGADRCLGAGDDCYKELIVSDKNGEHTIAILAVAENGFGCEDAENGYGYAWFNSHKFWNKLDELKGKYNSLVVISHAGLEDTNLPLPEIREHYKRYIDHGADVVIAHHPHVIQGKEVYKGKDIYYSLGNAVFEQLDTGIPYNPESIAVELEVDGTKTTSRVIPLKYEDGILKKDESAFILYDKACSLLEDESKYQAEADKVCLDFYAKIYRNYYASIFGRQNKLKNLVMSIMYLFGKDIFDESMLFHNLFIETHYWCVKRALQLKRRRLTTNEN
ncbi:CapA family protein [Butyrivibrio sp. AE2015]|uniref:CapA family protein n=1 Tax=Butyrivibrio sp. AE2015 TaxID=1280663 RepID=UPI0003B37623|nr:CapA family protein [Butyrivibrio sp. AE2015]